jgi:hypothetical protein
MSKKWRQKARNPHDSTISEISNDSNSDQHEYFGDKITGVSNSQLPVTQVKMMK